eukprot:PhF_6_TR31193/c1_g1_i1/m.45749
MVVSTLPSSTVIVLSFVILVSGVSTALQSMNKTAAITFYVSPSRGSNTNSGLSPTEAWETLEGASQQVANYLRNSGPLSWTLLLERNSTFINDPLVLDGSVRMFGFSVMIADFGSPSLPLPLLQHSPSLNNLGDACLVVTNITGLRDSFNGSLTIQNLHFSGCAQGITLASAPNGIAVNVLLKGNVFMDINTPLLRYTPPNPMWAVAINLAGGNFENFTLQNNIAARIDVFFSSSAFVRTMNYNSNCVQSCGGNCVNFGIGVDLTLQDSVFLRDASTRLFEYGVTDIIVGGLTGYNSVLRTDFLQRGEYAGGPDGCCVDLETACEGFVVDNCVFSESWGSGIMIFGHASTSQNVTISNNVFWHAGCVQNRDDRGGIAVMCPGGFVPTGNLVNNTFYTCPNVPAIYPNPSVPHCAASLNQTNTRIDPPQKMVDMPQLSFNPPDPVCTDMQGAYNVIGVTTTSGATIHYTLDGSRPTQDSPILPASGINIPWPGPAVAILLRAFKSDWIPSVTNGAILEANYFLCRSTSSASERGPGGGIVGNLVGNIDSVTIVNSSFVIVAGWAVDSALPKHGWGPVTVLVSVDAEPCLSYLALLPRPDLVVAKIAPNPNHGFSVILPLEAATTLLSNGRHTLTVKAIGTPSTTTPLLLPWKSTVYVCNGIVC